MKDCCDCGERLPQNEQEADYCQECYDEEFLQITCNDCANSESHTRDEQRWHAQNFEFLSNNRNNWTCLLCKSQNISTDE